MVRDYEDMLSWLFDIDFWEFDFDFGGYDYDRYDYDYDNVIDDDLIDKELEYIEDEYELYLQ